MKTHSIMETQHNLATILREVDAGYTVQITRRKKIVAVLQPPPDEAEVTFPDFAERARRTWRGSWKGCSSDALLDESRGAR